jgi:transposase-like protein
MAHLNLTLNQEEIQELLTSDNSEAFRRMLERTLNEFLKAESSEQLRAERYERTEARVDTRNGFYQRGLTTRIGRIQLEVPRHRHGTFESLLFSNYTRSESALILSMTEMVINGVSTRRVSKVVEQLCGKSFSKSTVSAMCKKLDGAVEEFRNRPLEGDYPFLLLDATYFRVRENHHIVSKAFFIALTINGEGLREVIGFGVYDCESKDAWREFLLGLKARGLKGILLVTSDAHEGLREALSREFPSVPWQRCQFHFSRNISEKAPKKYQAGLRSELNEMFNCKTLAEAVAVRDRIIADYGDVAPAAMDVLERGFSDSMAVMAFPYYLRKFLRTSNHLERLNRELKRRSSVIGIFPNQESVLRLMGSVLIEIHDAFQVRRAIFKASTLEKLLSAEVSEKQSALKIA